MMEKMSEKIESEAEKELLGLQRADVPFLRAYGTFRKLGRGYLILGILIIRILLFRVLY